MPNNQRAIDSVVCSRGLAAIKKGMRCNVDGRPGTICGGSAATSLNVKFDSDNQVLSCEPEWRMEIYNASGEIVHRSGDLIKIV